MIRESSDANLMGGFLGPDSPDCVRLSVESGNIDPKLSAEINKESGLATLRVSATCPSALWELQIEISRTIT